jgi:hypothetical protein
MNKNTSNKIIKKTSKIFPLQDFEIADDEIFNKKEIVKNNKFQNDSNLEHQDLEEITPYQKALFKKRIFWQATIFALKIVIPVVIMAIILMQFTK